MKKKAILIGIFSLLMLKAFSSETESMKFVKNLGIGYNWGNTFDVVGGGVNGFEIGWGAPISTKEMFEDLKSRGITTIRLPVAWSRGMAEDNKIDENVAARVNEVVDYAINSGLYVILNIHWDGGWINDPNSGFTKDWKGCMDKYVSIWNQLCERYKNYDEHLIFESLNEEGCFYNVWSRYSGGNKKTAFEVLNRINQTFVNTVRQSSGKNKKRYLLIAGYATDIECTCAPEFRMPQDKINRCMISVHYYTPSTFAILEEDASWGKVRKTWGTEEDYAELKKNLEMMKKTFQDKGIPVIIGEYGTVIKGKEVESVRRYLTAVAESSYDLGFCPVLWAGATDIYNRRELKFDDEEIGQMYKRLSEKKR